MGQTFINPSWGDHQNNLSYQEFGLQYGPSRDAQPTFRLIRSWCTQPNQTIESEKETKGPKQTSSCCIWATIGWMYRSCLRWNSNSGVSLFLGMFLSWQPFVYKGGTILVRSSKFLIYHNGAQYYNYNCTPIGINTIIYRKIRKEWFKESWPTWGMCPTCEFISLPSITVMRRFVCSLRAFEATVWGRCGGPRDVEHGEEVNGYEALRAEAHNDGWPLRESVHLPLEGAVCALRGGEQALRFFWIRKNEDGILMRCLKPVEDAVLFLCPR